MISQYTNVSYRRPI